MDPGPYMAGSLGASNRNQLQLVSAKEGIHWKNTCILKKKMSKRLDIGQKSQALEVWNYELLSSLSCILPFWSQSSETEQLA